MNEICSFFCQGEAQGQPRGRAFKLPNGQIRVASAKRGHPVHSWKTALRDDALKAMGGKPLVEEAIGLDMLFLMKRPGSMPKRTANDLVSHTKKPDLDNLEKAVKDALTSIVWRDDCQVCAVAKRKRYVRGTEAPGVHIRVSADAIEDLPF